MGSWRPPTYLELMARFGRGEHACVIDDVLELESRGPGHQPRVRGGTRVRVLEVTPGDLEPIYKVEILEDRGQGSGYWALIGGGNLTEAPELGFRDWLRSLR